MLRDRSDIFVDTALSHVGYQARPGMQSTYGATVGYDGQPWAGAFVDVVAREAGLILPACVYSPSGLSEFIKQRRWHARPRPGDIVFFTFPTVDDTGFGVPHVGIVVDGSQWDRLGRIETVEGCTDSGAPRGPRSRDGVYRRVRHDHEVLGFGRPDYRAIAKEVTAHSGVPVVRASTLLTGRSTRSIRLVQLALARVCGLRHAKEGVFDGPTTSAYARWQRMIGYAGRDVTGTPDPGSLRRLARETGLFSVED